MGHSKPGLKRRQKQDRIHDFICPLFLFRTESAVEYMCSLRSAFLSRHGLDLFSISKFNIFEMFGGVWTDRCNENSFRVEGAYRGFVSLSKDIRLELEVFMRDAPVPGDIYRQTLQFQRIERGRLSAIHGKYVFFLLTRTQPNHDK